ncbi:MAG: nucleotidyltransferase domain-containing protein [Gemmatimonadaceae bacterium]
MANMTLEQLVSQLQKAYGPELECVVLYGSAAAGEHIPKRSDYNVLVIVKRLGSDQLRAAAATARAWSDSGNEAPLTLTTEEWRRSADIFPMEYADMLERHRILYGAAPFDGIEVSKEHLRLELEQQAMGKLLHLRQGLLAAGNDGRRQLQLLEGTLSTIMVLFRSVVRLHGESPPADNDALSLATASITGLDAAPFQRVVRHVRRSEKLAPSEAAPVLSGYLDGVQRLVGYLDRFGQASR